MYRVPGAPLGIVLLPAPSALTNEHDGGLGGAEQLEVHPDGGVFLPPELPPCPLPLLPYFQLEAEAEAPLKATIVIAITTTIAICIIVCLRITARPITEDI